MQLLLMFICFSIYNSLDDFFSFSLHSIRLDAVVVFEVVAGQEGGGLDEAEVIMACGHLPAVVAEAVDGK